MAVILNKANLVLKDANGNVGKIEQLSSNDLAKIKTAVSDVALVVNQSNHKPIAATTTNKGVVQLATSADVASGAIDKVVTAEQLHNSTTGTSALATENLARIDAVVTEAGISVDHTNTNQLKTAVTTLISKATPATATANTLGVVKPDNNTIKINSNGVLTATKATQDSAGQQINTTYVKGVTASNATITVTKGNGTTSTATINNVANATNASNLGGYPASDYIRSANLNTIRKNDGNDYYDDSDITSLIYAGNGAGTIRNEIANGNFARVHPGQTIRGKATGTTYIVVGCNIYLHRGDTEPMQNHIGLMPIQLVGNAGNLLWSGRTYAGSGVNNTKQGYAPWASDNNTEGKNQTSCYRDSYIAKTVLPKVDNLWLKPDFENQGISVLTFRNLDAMIFNANAVCMSNPNWKGCATSFWLNSSTNGWTSKRLVLPSEPEIFGHYAWAGSSFESGSQYMQLPLFRHKEVSKVYPRTAIWLKDSASASYACIVAADGVANNIGASRAFCVCPLFLIA